ATLDLEQTEQTVLGRLREPTQDRTIPETLAVPRESKPALVMIARDPDRQVDAESFHIALHAAAAATGATVEIRHIAPEDYSEADLLVWLSRKDLPNLVAIRSKPKVIVRDCGTLELRRAGTWILLPGKENDVAVYQRATLPENGHPIWRDGFGQPLLQQSNVEGVTIYHFGSRFHPISTDLSSSDVFLTWIADSLFPAMPAAFARVKTGGGPD